MSHIVEFKGVVIANLEALKLAIKLFCPTMEVVKATHYRTWKDGNDGRLVGDWPLPEGVTEAEVGENAEYIIRVTDKRLAELGTTRDEYNAPYEIGVVPSRTEKGSYSLATDFWCQGNGVLKEVGIGEYSDKLQTAFDQLYMHYRCAEAKLAAEAAGDQIEFEQQKDGWIAKVYTEARLSY